MHFTLKSNLFGEIQVDSAVGKRSLVFFLSRHNLIFISTARNLVIEYTVIFQTSPILLGENLKPTDSIFANTERVLGSIGYAHHKITISWFSSMIFLKISASHEIMIAFFKIMIFPFGVVFGKPHFSAVSTKDLLWRQTLLKMVIKLLKWSSVYIFQNSWHPPGYTLNEDFQ